MGDMIADSAENNNWNAIIINGCVRDVEALSNFKIGIFALGSVPKKSEKKDREKLVSTLISAAYQLNQETGLMLMRAEY